MAQPGASAGAPGWVLRMGQLPPVIELEWGQRLVVVGCCVWVAEKGAVSPSLCLELEKALLIIAFL